MVMMALVLLPAARLVLLQAAPGDLAVVSVWIDSGSRYEAPSLNGASNLISRVALKVRAAVDQLCLRPTARLIK